MTEYKPLKTEYHHSSLLSQMLEKIPREQYITIHEMLDAGEAEYRQHKKVNKGIAVAANYQDTIQEYVNKSLVAYEGKVTCKKGCSYCCYLHVDISDDEAKLLIAYSNELGFTIDWEKLERQNKYTGTEAWRDLPAEDKKCIFLSNTGVCQVYDHRPMSCRKAMVISEPEKCDVVKDYHSKVMWAVSLPAEVVSSAIFNATDSGTLADMMLKNKDFKYVEVNG